MLENILRPNWLEKKPRFAFIIGFVYSMIAILAAYVVFPRSQGIASIAFLSVLLVPSLNSIIKIEELQDVHEKKFTLKRIFKDHADIIEVYFLLFLGIFIAYALFSIRFTGLLVNGIFDQQLRVIGYVGQSAGTNLDFGYILSNNMNIFLIFLVLSLIFGAGSILFLAWNASVWGVVFGYVATMSDNAFTALVNILSKVIFHTVFEAAAYFFAIIAGGIMSQAILREKLGSAKFLYVLKDGGVFVALGVMLLLIGAVVEVYVFPML